MADEKITNNSIPPWIVTICGWFWRQRSFVWSTIGLGVLLGIFTGWLFADPSSYTKLPVYWFYLNRGYILMGLIILVELFALSYVVNLVPTKPSVSRRLAKNFDTSFYYRLTNKFLGKDQSLDVRSDGNYDLMMAQTENNKKSQFWKLVDLGNGKYALQTASLGKGFSLETIDEINNSPWMGTTGKHNRGQMWTFAPWGDGTYKITNDLLGYEKSLDTRFDSPHQPFFNTGNYTGEHWILTPLEKIDALPNFV